MYCLFPFICLFISVYLYVMLKIMEKFSSSYNGASWEMSYCDLRWMCGGLVMVSRDVVCSTIFYPMNCLCSCCLWGGPSPCLNFLTT